MLVPLAAAGRVAVEVASRGKLRLLVGVGVVLLLLSLGLEFGGEP